MRVELQSTWNVNLMESLLEDYHDKEILTYLWYGWPVNRPTSAPDPLVSNINHKGANAYKQDIDDYLMKEMQLGRIAGPFKQIPFNNTTRLGVSPLN